MRRLLGAALALLGGVAVSAPPAEACNWGRRLWRLPLGAVGNRLAVLEMDAIRNWHRQLGKKPRRVINNGYASRWWGTAYLRWATLSGTPVGAQHFIGKFIADETSLAADFRPVVQKALRRVSGRRGFVASRPVEQRFCTSGTCRPPTIQAKGKVLRAVLGRRGGHTTSRRLTIPAWVLARRGAGMGGLGQVTGPVAGHLELDQVVRYRVGGYDVFVLNVGTGFNVPYSPHGKPNAVVYLPTKPRRCRHLHACFAHDRMTDHRVSVDYVLGVKRP